MLRKKVLYVVFTLILCLSVVYASASNTFTDDSVNQEELTSQDEVSPASVPEHICHSGTEHRRCETEYYPEPCGCLYGTYMCCCGRTMGFFVMPCDEHGNSVSSANGMNIILSGSENIDINDAKSILKTHAQIKEKIDKESMSSENDEEAQDEIGEDLVEQSDKVLDTIKSIQR